jgi:hypothetical protein
MQKLSQIAKEGEVITIVHEVQWFFWGTSR